MPKSKRLSNHIDVSRLPSSISVIYGGTMGAITNTLDWEWGYHTPTFQDTGEEFSPLSFLYNPPFSFPIFRPSLLSPSFPIFPLPPGPHP